MAIYTLGAGTSPMVCPKQEDHNLGIKALAGEDLKVFQAVKIDGTTGEVSHIAAADDELFGIIRAGGKDGELVTVDCAFSHIMKVKAGANITAYGAKLQFTAWDSSLGLNTVSNAGAAKVVQAIALSLASSGGTLMVGVLRCPHFKPA